MASSPRHGAAQQAPTPASSGRAGFPTKQGMYNPAFEKDACGLAMVATLRGEAGHDIIDLALTALRNLEHRGAIGSDAGTGDGAGILTQMPDAFLRAVVGFDLPPVGEYAAGMAFLPRDADERAAQKGGIERIAASENLTVLGWREVPTADDNLGKLAFEARPAFEQLFVSHPAAGGTPALSGIALDRRAYRLRTRARNELDAYFVSLSARTLGYKGMVTTLQLEPFYPDLSDERFASELAVVHSRYSTTPSRRGRSHSRCACSPTTARSTPSAATATGCGPASRSCSPSCSATSGRCCRSAPRARATRPRSTRSSSS